MKAPGKRSLDRAATALRSVLLSCPGCNRAELISRVAEVAECHASTAEKAVGEALGEGFVKTTGRAGSYRYFWNDNPATVDRAPQVVRRMRADQAPRIVRGSRCADGISWLVSYGFGAFA